MLKTLLVEDEAAKAERIKNVLDGVEGFDLRWVTATATAAGARQAMRETQFDLVILDVALPMTSGAAVSRDAGLQLIEELTIRPDRYRSPVHIVGLTGYAEIYEAHNGRFSSRALTLEYYRPDDSSWEERLRARVKQRLNASQAAYASKADVVVVCALPKTELRAVLSLPWEWSNHVEPAVHTLFWKGKAQSDGTSVTVIALSLPRVGPSAAAALTAKAVLLFRPKLVAMCGIMAGVKAKTRLGDLVAINPSWDWGSGKWVDDAGQRRFLPSPHQVGPDAWVRERLMAFSMDQSPLNSLWESWRGSKPEHVPRLLVGPAACGASVVADGALMEALKEHHRDVLGVEMEAYGVFAAIEESPEPPPRALIVKSVVDFADGSKDDDYHEYGSYVSAGVLARFVERYGSELK